jgi:hypothetical protein
MAKLPCCHLRARPNSVVLIAAPLVRLPCTRGENNDIPSIPSPFVFLRSCLRDGVATGPRAGDEVRDWRQRQQLSEFQRAADQQVIVEQLKRSGVRFVRTSLRPDDKNTAKAAQESLQAWFKSTFVISHGIGLL